jgi:hypothetical protein
MHSRSNFALGIGAIALAAFAVGRADAQTATPITKCGTIISAPGNYDIAASLTSTSNTIDCIEIDSPGVNLAIAKNISLSGPGGSSVTAAGVSITKSAYGVVLNVAGATIQGFGIGIDDEAVAGSIIGGTLTGNAAQGILVKDTSSVHISSVVCQNNGGAGLELLRSSGVIVDGVPALQSNEGYGLWVHSSSDNQFFNLDIFGNQLSGAYVGESGTDRLSAKQGARDEAPSNRNVFLNSGAIQNGGGGFVIDLGDSHNVITGSAAQSNLDDDMIDENKDCDHNIWNGNSFEKANATCIH